MFKVLLKHIGKYRWAALLTPVWTALEVVMGVLIPYVTASIIDKGIVGSDLARVTEYGALMIGISVFSLVFGVLSGAFGAYSSSGFAANLRSAMYANIQRFSFSDVDEFSTAGLVTRMTTDVGNIQNAFQMLLRISVRAPLNLVASLFMCIFINARLSLVFLVAMVVLVSAISFIIVKASALFRQLMERYDNLNAVVRENVAGVRVVKSFVRENHESLKFRAAAGLIYRLNVKVEMLMNLNSPIMNLVTYGCMIALSWFGAHFIVSDQLTTGQLTSLFSYVMTILMSLMMLSMIFVQLAMSVASAERVAEVISHTPSMPVAAEPAMDMEDGSIWFKDVTFKYNDTGSPVLDGLNFRIESGETIGIIGGTGSGKTSLVNLISRLYDVSEGSVYVGGKDVREYDPSVLSSKVACVLQKSVLFSGTILENLRWGKEDATLQECMEACSRACADEFVQTFPDKYDTVIDQGGTNVSGGQRQRLCIARSLLKDPRILILDDSTSAVDTATEARIRKSLLQKMPGLTLIIISQRIASIKDADRIMVLDSGRISGFDTHEALLAGNEIYRDIYSMQESGEEADFDK